MLSVQHITTGSGKKQILTDVSFDVAKGDVVLLTGGNGSGKSTVLKTIYGLLKPWTPESRVVFYFSVHLYCAVKLLIRSNGFHRNNRRPHCQRK